MRIGLRYVRGLSETTAREIEEERRRGGEFRSLFDFLERTRLQRKQVEKLIACGCFDSFGLERREPLWQLGLVYRPEGRLPPLTDWDGMAADYNILGRPRAGTP